MEKRRKSRTTSRQMASHRWTTIIRQVPVTGSEIRWLRRNHRLDQILVVRQQRPVAVVQRQMKQRGRAVRPNDDDVMRSILQIIQHIRYANKLFLDKFFLIQHFFLCFRLFTTPTQHWIELVLTVLYRCVVENRQVI